MKAPSEAEVRATIDDVVGRIVAGYDPDRIILFGSFARGDWHADSDIDLAVIKDSDVPFIRRALPVLRLMTGVPRDVEVLVYTPQEFEAMLARVS